MEFERFKKIIEFNDDHKGAIAHKIKGFYSEIGIEAEHELLNILQVIDHLLKENKYIVAELPFADQEIGAIYYKNDCYGYVLLNSSLPKVNVRFALCHEIYHILYHKSSTGGVTELYLSEHYNGQIEELHANAFAGALLMPERSFRNMCRKFVSETAGQDVELTLLIKLMNYFQVPYMAVLVRCYELEIFDGGNCLQQLLTVDKKTIEQKFFQLWLDEEILKPTKKDDFLKLEYFVQSVGRQCLRNGTLDEKKLNRILINMRRLYMEIRG